MAKRRIVRIDETKCNGCGLCVPACAEGAIQIVDGKARLVADKLCDGLGNCLGECPEGAITVEEREADDFETPQTSSAGPPASGSRSPSQLAPDRIPLRRAAPHEAEEDHGVTCGCPGAAVRSFGHEPGPRPAESCAPAAELRSALTHWPVQIMLVPPSAPFLKNADLLIAADCVPFTVPDFHSRYLEGRVVLVGCPKLDDLEFYRKKLKAIVAASQPRSITVLRMEVPCCSGIAQAAIEARDEAAPNLPVEVHTIGIRGGSTVERARVESSGVPLGGERCPESLEGHLSTPRHLKG